MLIYIYILFSLSTYATHTVARTDAVTRTLAVAAARLAVTTGMSGKLKPQSTTVFNYI